MGKTYLILLVSTTDWRFEAKSVGGGKSGVAGVEGYGGKGAVVSSEWQVGGKECWRGEGGGWRQLGRG